MKTQMETIRLFYSKATKQFYIYSETILEEIDRTTAISLLRNKLASLTY